eukprot:SAG31_NODE_1165_length_9578_cov_5.386011_1_plen_185_part_00
MYKNVRPYLYYYQCHVCTTVVYILVGTCIRKRGKQCIPMVDSWCVVDFLNFHVIHRQPPPLFRCQVLKPASTLLFESVAPLPSLHACLVRATPLDTGLVPMGATTWGRSHAPTLQMIELRLKCERKHGRIGSIVSHLAPSQRNDDCLQGFKCGSICSGIRECAHSLLQLTTFCSKIKSEDKEDV